MYTKNKIAAILMAFVVAMAMIVPMVMGDNPTTSATVNNAAPVVSINPISDQTPSCTVTVNGTLEDKNGLDDVTSLTYEVKDPDNIVNKTGTITTVESPWSFSFDLSVSDKAGDWTVTVTATDAGGATGSDTETFDVSEVMAFSIDFTTVKFGTVGVGVTKPVDGDKDMNTESYPTIKNDGNVDMDVKISATDMAGTVDPTNKIDNENLGAKVDGAEEQDLDAERTFDVNIDPGKTTNIDYTLTAPIGTKPDSYTGTTTITGIAG